MKDTLERGSRIRAGRSGAGLRDFMVRRTQVRPAAIAGLCAALFGLAVSSTVADASDAIFTVARLPVEARAENAVAAKQKAIADGQAAALRALMKRLVPVTRYAQLRQIELPPAGDLLSSVQIRSERNSSTDYVAELDIAFRPDAVRSFLQRSGLPFVEQTSAPVVVVALYKAPVTVNTAVPRDMAESEGAKLWRDIWSGLDLANGLTPIELKPLGDKVHTDTVRMVFAGEGGGQRILAGEYGTQTVVLAEVQADLTTRRLRLELAGQDAVGPLRLTRDFRFEPNDFAYALELAAVVAQGIVEGRWKSIALQGGRARNAGQPSPNVVGPAPASSGPAASRGADFGIVPLRVLFVSLAQWQQIRTVIETTPGVGRVEVNGLSPREADVAIAYPAGGDDLARALEARGLRIEPYGDGWLLR